MSGDDAAGGRLPRSRGRLVAGVAVVAVALAAMTVFVLPFAFPTPPPIVGRFTSSLRVSPEAGLGQNLRILVRMNETGVVTLQLRDPDRGVLRTIADEVPVARSPTGGRKFAWGGRDDAGRPVPDGTYNLDLQARSGRKKRQLSRKVVVDTQPPGIDRLDVRSAALAGPGAGECRVEMRVADAGQVKAEATDRRGRRLASVGWRPVRAGGTFRWAWSGRSKGVPVPAGSYRVAIRTADATGNEQTIVRSCWVGYVIGRTIPARPRPGDLVRVALTTTGGRRLPGSERVALRLYRRGLSPGTAATNPVGRRVATAVNGRLGTVEIRLPRTIAPRELWLVASTRGGRALIGLAP